MQSKQYEEVFVRQKIIKSRVEHETFVPFLQSGRALKERMETMLCHYCIHFLLSVLLFCPSIHFDSFFVCSCVNGIYFYLKFSLILRIPCTYMVQCDRLCPLRKSLLSWLQWDENSW